jgi:aldehyde dehydrogenase (NAD+)
MNYKGNIDYRKETLVKLLDNLIIMKMKLLTLCIKISKPPFESVITETNYVITELKHT